MENLHDVPALADKGAVHEQKAPRNAESQDSMGEGNRLGRNCLATRVSHRTGWDIHNQKVNVETVEAPLCAVGRNTRPQAAQEWL